MRRPVSAGALALVLLLALAVCGCAGELHADTWNQTPTAPPQPSASPAAGNFTAYFFKVGQGDSALLSYGDSRVLIDLGPNDEETVNALYDYLVSYDALHLDAVVVSHPHADHYGDLEALEALGVSYDEFYYDGLSMPYVPAGARALGMGDTFTVGGQTFRVLWPDRTTYTDKNDNSLVVEAEYGEVGFLFTGDATAKSETAMIAYRTLGECEVLKVGHHGSRYSSSADFLAVVDPRVSVIMVGENDYGHPAESTISRLQGYGGVYTTYDRTVVVTTDGSGVSASYA